MRFQVDFDLFYYRNLLSKLPSIFQLTFHFFVSRCDYFLLLCTLIAWLAVGVMAALQSPHANSNAKVTKYGLRTVVNLAARN